MIHHPLAPALTYIMSAYKDKAGFYFLSIVTDGDLWGQERVVNVNKEEKGDVMF